MTTYLHTIKGYSTIPFKKNIPFDTLVVKLLNYCENNNPVDLLSILDIDKYKQDKYNNTWTTKENNVLIEHVITNYLKINEEYVKDTNIYTEQKNDNIVMIMSIPKKYNKSSFGNFYEYNNGIEFKVPFTSYKFKLPYTSDVKYHNPNVLFSISNSSNNIFK